jgi:hypothetical protein
MIQIYDRPHHLSPQWQMVDALFRLKLAVSATGAVEVNVWLAAYGLPEFEVKSFRVANAVARPKGGKAYVEHVAACRHRT